MIKGKRHNSCHSINYLHSGKRGSRQLEGMEYRT